MMYAWILKVMLALQPDAPWLDTYAETALAVDEEARARPFYEGEHGAERTAMDMVALFWFESRFKQDAIDRAHSSVCLGQIDLSNLPTPEGWKRADLQTDVVKCVRTAARMMKKSHAVCASFVRNVAPGYLLAWYAGGGPTCARSEDAARKSSARVYLGVRLFERYPFRLVALNPSSSAGTVR